MIEIRRAAVTDAAAIAGVHIASWRSTYRGIVPEAHLASLELGGYTDWWASALSGPGEVFVAERDHKTVGFVAGGPVREVVGEATAELYAIYLVETAQRQRAGTALLRALVTGISAEGHESMAVWVLAANPAMHFYAALGAVPMQRKLIEIGGASLPEIALVWRSLPALLEKTAAFPPLQ